ncbi:hypothetical protein, partial [Klebsiella pneumoniae]|uniref:hypothetical protein n=1 Tax=Klebsiella pneumoniae TaxID=573 RepID=UPI00272FFFA2
IAYKLINNYLLEYQINNINEYQINNITLIDAYVLPMDYQIIKIIGIMRLTNDLKVKIYRYIRNDNFKKNYNEIKCKNNLIKILG